MDGAGLTNALNTIMGSTTRAKILIADKRINSEKYIIPKKAVSPGSSAAVPGGTVPSGATGALQTAASTGSNAIKAVGGAISGGDSPTIGAASTITNAGEFNKQFTVQFNPSTLNISGFSGGSYDVVDFSGPGKAVKNTPLDPNIAFNVTLIFDQTDLSTSFPMDSLTVSASQLISNAIKSITVGLDTMSISVQAVTEAFIGILTNQYTKLICFQWGSLKYKGVLKSVNANYKMFDIYGRPARSEVALSLYLADKDVKQAGGANELGQWADAYNAAFSDATMYGTTIGDKVKKIQNIIQG